MQDRVPLTSLPRELLAAGYQHTTYNRVYHGALAGQIPAAQAANGRWTWAVEDLPRIAAALGLHPARVRA